MSNCRIVKSSVFNKEFWYCKEHDDDAGDVIEAALIPTECYKIKPPAVNLTIPPGMLVGGMNHINTGQPQITKRVGLQPSQVAPPAYVVPPNPNNQSIGKPAGVTSGAALPQNLASPALHVLKPNFLINRTVKELHYFIRSLIGFSLHDMNHCINEYIVQFGNNPTGLYVNNFMMSIILNIMRQTLAGFNLPQINGIRIFVDTSLKDGEIVAL